MIKKTFLLSILCLSLLSFFSESFAAKDIMEIMYQPAKTYESVIDLGNTRNAVGDEVFKSSTQVGLQDNLGHGCFVDKQHISNSQLADMKKNTNYTSSDKDFCQEILGGDWDISEFSNQKQAPLVVRITKFLLRLTIVLSITLIIYNGIMRVIESAKGGEVKDAKNNLFLILGGIFVALLSVVLVNLVSSLSISSLIK